MTPIPELQFKKWTWTARGVVIETSAGPVLLPISIVDLICSESFRRVGCSESYRVGGIHTVGGLFKKVKKGLTRVRDNVRSGVAKTGGVGRWVVETEKRATRVAHQAAKVSDKIVRHPAFRAALAGASIATGGILAPASAAVETYTQIANKVEKGVEAAKAIDRGLSDPKKLADVREAEKIVREVIEPAKQQAKAGNAQAISMLAGMNAARGVLAKKGGPALPSVPRGVGPMGARVPYGFVRRPPRAMPWARA